MGETLTPAERKSCTLTVVLFVVAASFYAWMLRGFVGVGVVACVAAGAGAVTAVGLGNVVLGSARLAQGKRGLGWFTWGLVLTAVSAGGALVPAAPDHVLLHFPFGWPMLEHRLERLKQAVYEEDVELTRRLARAGLGTREPRDGFGDPLFDATRNPEIVRALLEGSLDPDVPDSDGYTRLMKPGSTEIAAVLLESGASPDTPGPQGMTPLMYAVMRDEPWTPLLLEAGADLRAVDEAGRAVIDHATPGSETERLLQEKAGHPPLQRLRDPAAPPELGRTDWVIGTESVSGPGVEQLGDPFQGSRLRLENRQLLRGDLLDVTVEIHNNTAQRLALRVEGRISPAAYFVGGSHEVKVANPYDAPLTQSFRWPPLALPAGGIGELKLELLTRAEESGDVDVTILARDVYRDLGTNLSLLRTPEADHPRVAISTVPGGGWTCAALAAAGIVLAVLVWRRGDPKKRAFLLGLAGLFVVTSAMSLLMLLALHDDLRTATSYEETTCTVLDRRLFMQTSADTGSGTRSRTRTSYSPRLALRYATRSGERVSEGFGTGMVSYGAIRDFALGGQCACWYDPENDRRVVVRRGISLPFLGLAMMPFAVAFASLFGLWRALGGKGPAGGGP